MFLNTNINIEDKQVVIIVRQRTEERLMSTCFRGRDKNLAGNFIDWDNAWSFFRQQHWAIEQLIDDVRETISLKSRTNSVCMEAPYPVGWSGTDDASKYRSDDLEEFAPNRKSVAMRVRPELTDVQAPLTDKVTIVYELRDEGKQIAVVVHSIYPGEDIGELVGDVTEREKVVFFDWNHQGYPC
jgi:hypothetical protein